jgi:hypothetical protein
MLAATAAAVPTLPTLAREPRRPTGANKRLRLAR